MSMEYAFYFDGKTFIKYTLNEIKKLENDVKKRDVFIRVRKNLYCSTKLMNDKPLEWAKVDYHGLSKKEFHHHSSKMYNFICDEFDIDNEESFEHKTIKELIYKIANESHLIKLEVDSIKYDLVVKKVYMEKYINLKCHVFKPDLFLILDDVEESFPFIEKYDNKVFLEICYSHSNSKKKIEAFQFENKLLLQLNVKSKYYMKTRNNENDYVEKKEKQLRETYARVEIHSSVLKDEIKFKATDDNGIIYYLSVKDDNIFVATSDDYANKLYSYKNIKFTVDIARLYILYRIRLSRDKK